MNTAIISLLCTIIGIVISYATFCFNNKKSLEEKSSKEKKETANEVEKTTKIDTKLDILIKNVDEIRLDNREISKQLQTLSERVTKLETRINNDEKLIEKMEVN